MRQQDMEVRLRAGTALAATVIAAGAVVLSLCAWQQAPVWIEPMSTIRRPVWMVWSLRAAALGGIAAAQMLVMATVVDLFWRRDRLSDWIKAASLVLFLVAGIASVLMALAGR